MKKFILLLTMFLAVGWLTAQNVTPRQGFAIADATTTFGKNIPVGTLIYDVANDILYHCDVATASASTLTTASANFTDVTTSTGATNLTWDAVNGHIESSTGTDADVGGFATNSTNYGFVIGSNSVTGAYLNSDGTWDDLDTDISANADVSANTSARHNAVTLNTSATDAGLTLSTQEIGLTPAMTDNKIVTVDDAAGIGTGEYLRATANGVEARTVAEMQTDLSINTAAEENLDSSTETFEESTTGVGGDSHTLANTAVTAQDPIVALNGAVLNPTAYTLTTTTITIDIQVYQYDEVTITYWY